MSSEDTQLYVYLMNLVCGALILISIDAWLRLRGVKDPALVWLYLSLLSWVVAIGVELLHWEKGSRIDQAHIKYVFSILSSVLWAWTAFKLESVQEVLSSKSYKNMRLFLVLLVLGLSLIVWFLLFTRHFTSAIAVDVIASSIAGITLGCGLSYSFYRYGNQFLAALTAVTFVIFIQRQVYFGLYGRPKSGFWVWYFLSNMDFLIMIFIALAVAWALSDASRLKPVAWSPRVQVIALFFDLRGSSQWAHEAAKGDFIYVKAFLDELRDSATNKANIGLSGRLKLIKFLGDGFLFVWEIPDASVSGSSRKIVRMAHELCVAYRTLAKGPTPSDKFPWGVPAGIGYGIDVGPAIRLTFENGSDDYLGEPLNLAAKMQDLARPAGGGVIQKRVWSLLDEELKAKFPKENTMQIGTQTFTVRMTEEVEYKNHRAKK